MAAPIKTPSTGDIWHLSIDDLLAPLPEKTFLGGPGPFVINLSASTAPIDVPRTFVGCEGAHVYQVQRMEDRRPRYRLRLGPFAKEEQADAILQKVRDIYPSALTATADADDLRAIETLQAKAEPQPPPVPAAVAQPAPPVMAKPAPPVMAKPAPPVMAKPAPPPPVAVKVVPPTLVARHTPAPPPPVAVKVVPPTLVARHTPAPPPAAAEPASSPAAPPVLTSALRVAMRAPAVMPPMDAEPRLPVQLGKGVPDLESTQTVRALTATELEDDEGSRWFVIQLSVAEQAFDPETVPNLDIFSVYRLYSVAGIDQGRIFHALRLGFFSEEIAASAVASYLTAFYEQPSIKRVSAAERQRFAEQPLEPRKDVGATGKQAVIEITNERYIRERRVAQTAGK